MRSEFLFVISAAVATGFAFCVFLAVYWVVLPFLGVNPFAVALGLTLAALGVAGAAIAVVFAIKSWELVKADAGTHDFSE